MAKVKIDKILEDDKSLLLAYDQGLEHGPVDFNARNVDPHYVLYIAVNGGFNGVILQKGIAEKYFENYKKKIPLIIKLNGKTNIAKIDAYSSQVCSVKRAVELGADAVGYTVYDGSPLEPKIFRDFSEVQEEAHDYGLPVIAWMYPRGKFVRDEISTSTLSYAARVGLELGADFVKIKYNDNLEEFKWIVRCAGKAKILVAGGSKMEDKDFLKKVSDIMKTGATGMAVGRNVWQHKDPLRISFAMRKIIFEESSVEDALRILEK